MNVLYIHQLRYHKTEIYTCRTLHTASNLSKLLHLTRRLRDHRSMENAVCGMLDVGQPAWTSMVRACTCTSQCEKTHSCARPGSHLRFSVKGSGDTIVLATINLVTGHRMYLRRTLTGLANMLMVQILGAHWLRKAKSLPHSYTDACPSSTALHLAPIRQKTDENVNLDSRKSTYSFLLNLLEGKDKVLNHYLSRPETTKVASALSAVPSLPESSLGCHNETV